MDCDSYGDRLFGKRSTIFKDSQGAYFESQALSYLFDANDRDLELTDEDNAREKPEEMG